MIPLVLTRPPYTGSLAMRRGTWRWLVSVSASMLLKKPHQKKEFGFWAHCCLSSSSGRWQWGFWSLLGVNARHLLLSHCTEKAVLFPRHKALNEESALLSWNSLFKKLFYNNLHVYSQLGICSTLKVQGFFKTKINSLESLEDYIQSQEVYTSQEVRKSQRRLPCLKKPHYGSNSWIFPRCSKPNVTCNWIFWDR